MRTERGEQANALLGEIQRQAAGRLTVFLGAAPGVGKTYAMLARARELYQQGLDVVVGIAETHGRSETQAMLDGLPCIPRLTIEYRGRALEEMDLDGLLARKPAVVLVDELAHRNVPGCRHERRWQDVEELLDAGIDVYTTVNIQHLESLNDVVYQITGVRVSETVPDSVFDRLRDIRLVDLPAQELIERLREGKVYLPEQAHQALQAFFSPSNLTALRELAMQTVAEYVDTDLRESRAARGLAGVAIQRHVLIAIDGRGQSEYLVRAGARIAERRGALWSVVTVDTGRLASDGNGTHPEQQRQRELDEAFSLARSLGGGADVLHGSDVVQAILDAAAARGARSIVVGRTRERPFARAFNRTITQRLLDQGASYELTIVSTPPARLRRRHAARSATGTLRWREALWVLAAAAVATAMAMLAEEFLALQDVSMVYLVAVLVVASRTRMSAAFFTALLCFLAYNFFFFDPRYTFYLDAYSGVTTVSLFLVSALIVGKLASQLRRQLLALRAANTHAVAMQDMSRELAKAADQDQIATATIRIMAKVLRAEAWVTFGTEEVRSIGNDQASDIEISAAEWTLRRGQPSGRYTDTLSQSRWWFLPVRAGENVLGAVGLRFPEGLERLPFGQQRLAERMVDDIAQVLLRVKLVSELESAKVESETERLRSALLSSVSHDLRSPLASMIGSTESLMRYGKDMKVEDRLALLETIHVEGERLDRYIQNLLDMTRLGQQGLSLTRDWIGVDELVGSASRRLERYKPDALIEMDIIPDLPPIHVHPALLEQAIFNVMENAVKFSLPGEPVRVSVRRTAEGELWLEISDSGPGIPEEDRRRIFDMFYSVERGDRGNQGTGLGLAIVQGIVGAHMGRVEAIPGRDGRGTVVRIILPWREYAGEEGTHEL